MRLSASILPLCRIKTKPKFIFLVCQSPLSPSSVSVQSKKSNSYVDLWGLLILRNNPQPTQPCDDAPVAIVVGSNGSGYGNNDSDNGIGDSDNSSDGSSNSSGNGGGIDNSDDGNGGSGNKEVAATAMAVGTNNNQLKATAEKTVVMAAAAT